MGTFKNKNNLRTIEVQIVKKLKNNEARPKFTGSYKKKKRVNYEITKISPAKMSLTPLGFVDSSGSCILKPSVYGCS